MKYDNRSRFQRAYVVEENEDNIAVKKYQKEFEYHEAETDYNSQKVDYSQHEEHTNDKIEESFHESISDVDHQSLQNHINVNFIETSIVKFSCRYCHEQFQSNNKLHRHVRSCKASRSISKLTSSHVDRSSVNFSSTEINISVSESSRT